MYILPALGTALYERLQDGIANNNLTQIETSLLDTYITPTLVYYVMSELPMGLSYQFYNKGMVRKSGEGQENPSFISLKPKGRSISKTYSFESVIKLSVVTCLKYVSIVN